MNASPRTLAQSILGLCLLSLILALVAQYAFGLAPCTLCYVQRVPFALGAVLAALSLRCPGRARGLMLLAGLVLLINGGIAVYHVGVEQHWWTFEICSAAEPDKLSVADLMAQMEKPVQVRCDQPAWSFHGITIAGLNIPFSGLLGLITLYLAYRGEKKA